MTQYIVYPQEGLVREVENLEMKREHIYVFSTKKAAEDFAVGMLDENLSKYQNKIDKINEKKQKLSKGK